MHDKDDNEYYPPYTYGMFHPYFRVCFDDDQKYSVVSFFTGIGGMDLGFVEAGGRIVHASDIEKESVQTYNENFVGSESMVADIRDLDPSAIPRSDIIIGGFPCQGFSSAGKRNVMDPRNSLAWEMIRCIDELKPEFIVAENVLGLKTMKHPDGGFVIDRIVKDLKRIGYAVRWKVLDASKFGVPSIRKRIFIIGRLHSNRLIFPDELSAKHRLVTRKIPIGEVLDVIEKKLPGAIPSTHPEAGKDWSQNIYVPLSPSDMKLVKHVPPGGNWRDIPKDVIPERFKRIVMKWGKKSPGFYRRPLLDQVCGTLTASMNVSHSMALHPTENRRYSVREAATIQSFPFDFKFSRNPTKAYQQIGNSVPPFLAWQLARSIVKLLDGVDANELARINFWKKQSNLLSFYKSRA